MRTPRVPAIAIVTLLTAGALPTLASTPAQRCAAAKRRAAVRKAQSRVECYVPGLYGNGQPDATCLAHVESRFATV